MMRHKSSQEESECLIDEKRKAVTDGGEDGMNQSTGCEKLRGERPKNLIMYVHN
jgi:hypothetical protein